MLCRPWIILTVLAIIISTSSSLLTFSFHYNNRNSSGSTPLHLAAATGHKDVASYLLEQNGIGRLKAALDNDGKSPLAVCLECKMNDWEGTSQLLRDAYKSNVRIDTCIRDLFPVELPAGGIYQFQVL